MIFVLFTFLIAFCILAFLVYKKGNKQQNILKKTVCAVFAVIIFAIGLEISVFNVNFYTSKGNESIDLTQYLQSSADKNGEYTLLSGTQIEFPEINTELKNIKITLSEDAPEAVDVTPYLTDEANEFYFAAPTRTIYKEIEQSRYFNIETVGKSSHLSLVFENDDDYIIKVKSVSANEERPFEFSLLRLLIVVAIMLFIYIFKPNSNLYKQKAGEAGYTKTNLTIIFLALQCIVFIIIGTLNPLFLGFDKTDNGIKLVPLPMENHNQYDELAQAVLDGRVYIDNGDVPESLIEMENPYDTAARNQQSKLTGDTYRWDVAYFDGHYYVYFGIVPLLLMYLPCRAILDAPFPSAIGIILFASIFAIGVFRLLGYICEKYFKNVSVGAYLLTSLAFVNCCGAMFLVKRPDFYSLPIICGMAFVVWGIYLWLKGKETEKCRNLYFLLGSLCCALAVGCRPQSVLMCAVAIPVFWEFFFKDKAILQRKRIVNLAVLAVPFIVVAAGIMYYNYIRFGSPFDFGSGYNLTTNDVTRRGFSFGRIGLGLFTYLFQTPNFTAVFPYLQSARIDTAYMGKTIYENCFGGLFAVTPVLWFTFLLPKVKGTLKDAKLFGFTICSILVGFAMVIADTQAGGLLQRYFSDFGYIFFIGASAVIFALFNKSKDVETTKNLTCLLFISTIFSFVYTLCLVFSVSDVTIDVQNPAAFGTIKHLIEFWL